MIKKIRPVISFLLYTCAAAAVLGSVPWLIGVASAAADPGAAVTAATATLSLPEWIGIGLAAVAGVRAMVDGALAFFRYLAPKTTNTLDDTIRDDLQLAHDKLDTLTTLVQGVAKPVVVNNITGPASAPTTGQAGFARLGLLVLLGAFSIATIVFGAGCATSTQATRQATLSTATVVTTTMLKTVEAYDKTAGDQIVAAATDEAKAKADLAALRSRVHGCIRVITAALDAIGLANSLNDDHSLEGVKTALGQAIDDVTALTGGH